MFGFLLFAIGCSVGEGASSYSTGIVGQMKGTSSETKLIQRSIELYKELSNTHGLSKFSH